MLQIIQNFTYFFYSPNSFEHFPLGKTLNKKEAEKRYTTLLERKEELIELQQRISACIDVEIKQLEEAFLKNEHQFLETVEIVKSQDQPVIKRILIRIFPNLGNTKKEFYSICFNKNSEEITNERIGFIKRSIIFIPQKMEKHEILTCFNSEIKEFQFYQKLIHDRMRNSLRTKLNKLNFPVSGNKSIDYKIYDCLSTFYYDIEQALLEYSKKLYLLLNCLLDIVDEKKYLQKIEGLTVQEIKIATEINNKILTIHSISIEKMDKINGLVASISSNSSSHFFSLILLSSSIKTYKSEIQIQSDLLISWLKEGNNSHISYDRVLNLLFKTYEKLLNSHAMIIQIHLQNEEIQKSYNS